VTVGSFERPVRVAIVGSGPSGFYAAAALLKSKDLNVEVDLFDRLPTPYGLVRGGVAPDHQKIKNVTRAYDKTAADPRFRFFGNVNVGTQVTVEQLRGAYDQVCFAVGAESSRKLGIPGEDLPGSYSATEFVGWYNAHPDYIDRAFDLGTRAVVVVGVGNVAMDVTRVIAQSPDRLHPTDIADHALSALRSKSVTDIYVLGRRGPAQAAFSPAEIKEIGELEGVDLVLPERSVVLDPASAAQYEASAAKSTRKNVEYLQTKAAEGTGDAPVRVHVLLCTSPTVIHGDEGKVSGVTAEINELYEDDRGSIRPRGTGQTFKIDAGLVFRSVGYRGTPLAGLPFDERTGRIPNEEGRITDATGAVLAGLYVVGWAKRGPSGLIGTNRADSVATVAHMLADAAAGGEGASMTSQQAASWVADSAPQHTTWADWQTLDGLERSRGEVSGRIRSKFTTVDEMLKALGRG
jgi:ferredoxin--NADP+ reductase